MFLSKYEGWESIIYILREGLRLRVSFEEEYNKHAFYVSYDEVAEIGIKWNGKRIFFLCFGVNHGKEIKERINAGVKTTRGKTINNVFIFSCNLEEFNNCRKRVTINCSQS